jgi:catechol-2,3-dioxygenase
MDHETRERLGARARTAGMEVRGPSNHGPMDSLYVRDPNGYVVELTAYKPGQESTPVMANPEARVTLDDWQRSKPAAL